MVNGGKPEQIFAERLAETIRDAQDVLDVGTSQRFAKELRRYEQWFAGKRYVAAGYEPSQTYGAYNCDCHQNIQAMSFADESFDAIQSHSTGTSGGPSNEGDRCIQGGEPPLPQCAPP